MIKPVPLEVAIQIYLDVMAQDVELDFDDPEAVAEKAFRAGALYGELLGGQS